MIFIRISIGKHLTDSDQIKKAKPPTTCIIYWDIASYATVRLASRFKTWDTDAARSPQHFMQTSILFNALIPY